MTDERWQLAYAIYEAAASLGEPERSQYVRGAAPDAEIAGIVLAMLEEIEASADSGAFPKLAYSEDPAASVPFMALSPGAKIGSYRVFECLGSGGMCEVYLAYDPRLDRRVAIKVLPTHLAADAVARERLRREALAAAALDHPFICKIFEIGEDKGTLFIVMEYISGETLYARLCAGPLPRSDALRIAAEVAEALEEAHAKPLVHRDLKPANVMLTPQGRAKVMDFGLAKRPAADELKDAGAPAAAPPLTAAGVVSGTPEYMSPEQVKGEPLDHRSDLFSFGIILCELLTGKHPFQRNSKVETMTAILRDPPDLVATGDVGLSPGQMVLIRRLLAKSPVERYQSMREVRDDLARLASSFAVAAEPEEAATPLIPLIGRDHAESGQPAVSPMPTTIEKQGLVLPRRFWIGMITLLGFVLLIGAGTWFRLTRPKTEAPLPPPKTFPLTSNAGQENVAAFSPDGNEVAYSWSGESSGNPNIYVKLIDAGTPLRLTTSPSPETAPAWSPDGRYIAFLRQTPDVKTGGAWGEGMAIFSIPALGGPERKLGQSAMTWIRSGLWLWSSARLAWSPNGKFLAIADKSAPQAPNSIFFLTVETGEKRRITFPPAQWWGDDLPAFSPDGHTLAFLRGPGAQARDIFLLSLGPEGTASGEPKRITFDDRIIAGLDWTADGHELVFSSNRSNGQRLWRIAASRGRPEPLSLGGENAVAPSISLHGARLAYTNKDVDTNIWRIERPQLMSRPSTGGPPIKFIASTRQDNAPQFSPDGKKIAFQSSRSGSYEIWMCDSNGSNPVQLTSFRGPNPGSPRWSPDSQRIAFDAPQEGHTEIYVISAEGGSARRLTFATSDDARPSWSKDGHWIYFGSRRSGEWQVWKVPAEGGSAVQITKNGGREAYESPDGRFLYYSKLAVSGIWRVSVNGGEETQVLDHGIQGHWAVFDRGICLLNPSSTPPTIEVFNLLSRRLEQVAVLPRESIPVEGYSTPAIALSPDARTILYLQADQIRSEIMVVENFR